MNKTMILGIACAVYLTLSLSACTTQAWYEGIKQGAANQCDSQPPGAREDCLSRLNNKNYDAYNKERAPTQ
jgi:ABC-type uncharacterized transport system auxiliary subunit